MTKNRKHDAARIQKINAIRAAARGITVEELSAAPCPTCCRSAHSAFLRCDSRGYAVLGCVDAHHAGHLQPNGVQWFYRPEAQALRVQELAAIS